MTKKKIPRRFRPLRIKDARGRKVKQLDPVAMYLLRQHDMIPAETLPKLAEEIDPGEVKKRQMGLISGVITAIAAYIFFFYYFRFFAKGSWRDPVMIMVYAGYLVVPPAAVYMMFRRARRARYERIHHIMLKHLRCPHCGYDIRGLPTDPEDGATVCPECGCAWKSDDCQAAGGGRKLVSDPPHTTGSQNAEDDGNDKEGTFPAPAG